MEEEKGDDIRAAEKVLYSELIGEVEPLKGARELIEDLKDRGHAVVLASSAKEDEVDHYLDLLDARDLADDWTTSADVESTKPEPDLVRAAMEKAGNDDAVMVGDTTWDVEAAGRAGIAVRDGPDRRLLRGRAARRRRRCRVRLDRRAAGGARRHAACGKLGAWPTASAATRRSATSRRRPEPRGKRGKKATAARFVVQEHNARRLHWDLRLEHEGALASWALPRGVPEHPDENRLAVRTEDHPLEYLEFHGEIPKGEYGAGTMTIWDRGTYEAEKFRDDEVIATFHGERVHGRYALFRTRESDWMIHRMDPPEDPDYEPFPDSELAADARPRAGAAPARERSSASR